jgi:hypothetical protein
MPRLIWSLSRAKKVLIPAEAIEEQEHGRIEKGRS